MISIGLLYLVGLIGITLAGINLYTASLIVRKYETRFTSLCVKQSLSIKNQVSRKLLIVTFSSLASFLTIGNTSKILNEMYLGILTPDQASIKLGYSILIGFLVFIYHLDTLQEK
jgi:TRAP-type C4-dicarboxylate transport system permease large subunit